MLTELLTSIPEGHPSIVRVSERSLVVIGQPSATNTIGYCHVHIDSEEIERLTIKCMGKSCRHYVSKSKQTKARTTCQHLHVLYCLLYQNTSPTNETTTMPFPAPSIVIPLSRQSTLDVAMNRSIPYHIPHTAIHTIMRKDAASLLETNDGWPDTYKPSMNHCTLCQSPLSEPRLHPGQSSQDTGYLLSESNPFKRIKLLVKVCTNAECKAMHQSNPLEIGTSIYYLK